MRWRLLAAGLGASLLLTPVGASAADISGEIGVASDYRYRGSSLSGGKPVLQGAVAVEHPSGAHAELWASTLDGSDSSIELDVTAGYAVDLVDGLGLDVSAAYFHYLGASSASYWEASATLELSRGPFGAHAGASFTPRQSATVDEAGTRRTNVYAFAGVEAAPASTPVRFKAQLGHERGAFDGAEHGGKWDWLVGVEADVNRVRAGLDYVGSDTGKDALIGHLAVNF